VLRENIYLTQEEIERFALVDCIGREDLKRERDRFMVSYYLILRYGDSIRIRRDRFFDRDGVTYYRNEAQKTGTVSYVPVKPRALEILTRYGYDLSGDTNQEANRKLKQLGALAGINSNVDGKPKWQRITTHTARRSAATNLMLAGVELNQIAQLGGWKSEKELRRYLKASGLDLARQVSMNGFFQ
jgi:integrase